VVGQQDDQGAVDVAHGPVAPAADLTEGLGGLPGLGECRVVEVGMPAAVEAGKVAPEREGKLKLDKAQGGFARQRE
jgi:hypothetical protein